VVTFFTGILYLNNDLYTNKLPVDPPKQIVAIVFAGRRDRLEILHRYLTRNFVCNGGILDRAVFVIKTNDQQDMSYIDTLVNSTSQYESIRIPKRDYAYFSWEPIYKIMEPQSIYIKMDDDIVYIADNTIQSITRALEQDNRWVTMSANVVNHPLLSYFHKIFGALHPYVMDLSSHGLVVNRTDWGVLKNPRTQNSTFLLDVPKEKRRFVYTEDSKELDATIAKHVEYDPFGGSWKYWESAVLSHYSLFHNLEEHRIDRYDFGLLNLNPGKYSRWSINFFAIRGEDVLQNPMPDDFGDDEIYYSVMLPKKLNRHSGVLGNAVVSHFSYGVQTEGVMMTDVLEKYKSLSLNGSESSF